MSLLKPRDGDLMDRLSILARKIVEGREDLREEFDGLTQRPLEQQPPRGKAYILCALNAAIWQREDRLRELRDLVHDDAEIAELAFAIQGLNDQRAALIAELNGTKSEKVYR